MLYYHMDIYLFTAGKSKIIHSTVSSSLVEKRRGKRKLPGLITGPENHPLSTVIFADDIDGSVDIELFISKENW